MGLLIELSARSLLITFVTSLVVFRPQLHSKGSSRDVPSISVYAWCREGALLLAAFIWKLCFAPSVILVAVLLKPRAKSCLSVFNLLSQAPFPARLFRLAIAGLDMDDHLTPQAQGGEGRDSHSSVVTWFGLVQATGSTRITGTQACESVF